MAGRFALLSMLAFVAGSAVARPPRIVSINPCVDAVLTQVADPAQIAGISSYSQDPAATSMSLDIARRFHATSGTAEEVVALAPDLVIAGSHVSPSTINALRRLGIPLLQLPVPESVVESEAQIRTIAEAAGHPGRATAMIARIQAALAAARPRDGRSVPALIWLGGGLVPGSGTLADDLLRRTGYSNLSARYGLAKWDMLPLEYVIARRPGVMFSAGSDRMLTHPALRKLGKRIAIRRFPFRLLQCGGPTIVTAVARLAELRRTLPLS